MPTLRARWSFGTSPWRSQSSPERARAGPKGLGTFWRRPLTLSCLREGDLRWAALESRRRRGVEIRHLFAQRVDRARRAGPAEEGIEPEQARGVCVCDLAHLLVRDALER